VERLLRTNQKLSRSISLLAAAITLGLSSGEAQSIAVSYVEVQQEASPRNNVYRVPRSLQVTRNENNSIRLEAEGRHGSAGKRHFDYEVKPGNVYRNQGDTTE
jgi:hypothetical protein